MAGFLNGPKIKGNHTAMMTGMLEAEAVFEHLASASQDGEATAYTDKVKAGWVWEELQKSATSVRAFKRVCGWGWLTQKHTAEGGEEDSTPRALVHLERHGHIDPDFRAVAGKGGLEGNGERPKALGLR